MMQYGNHDPRDRSYMNLFGYQQPKTMVSTPAAMTAMQPQGPALSAAAVAAAMEQQQQQPGTPLAGGSGGGCVHQRQRGGSDMQVPNAVEQYNKRVAAQAAAAAVAGGDGGVMAAGGAEETMFMGPSPTHGPVTDDHRHYHLGGRNYQQPQGTPSQGQQQPLNGANGNGAGAVGPTGSALPLPGTPMAPNNVISQQGIKNLVHEVQLKRQKEIRDMMKKKREKAVLVDRISRWLFPTSFILLNIVYWALFGDHDLW